MHRCDNNQEGEQCRIRHGIIIEVWTNQATKITRANTHLGTNQHAQVGDWIIRDAEVEVTDSRHKFNITDRVTTKNATRSRHHVQMGTRRECAIEIERYRKRTLRLEYLEANRVWDA